jgi:hypothetical protein
MNGNGMTELQRVETRLAKLIEDVAGSLQAEISGEIGSLRTEMHEIVERLDAATRRNTRSIAGGATTISALTRWADQRDAADGKRDTAIHNLEIRVRKLERTAKKKR